LGLLALVSTVYVPPGTFRPLSPHAFQSGESRPAVADQCWFDDAALVAAEE
jgi:hypothetical protein